MAQKLELCKKFRCWSNNNGIYELEFSGKTLNINIKLPYIFKLVQILDVNQKECISKVYVTSTCSISLRKLKEGRYYFNIFGSNNGFSFEWYIGGKQIIIEIKKNECYFCIPLYASWNNDLIKSGRLDFVLDKTILTNNRTMRKFALQLTANLNTTKEKILAIHDFVATNLYYDYDLLKSGENTNLSIEDIIATKKCVCQGYADLTLTMLKNIDLEAENILCYAIGDILERGWSHIINRTSELNHIMTRVKCEDKWLYMDVTWDSGNRFENNKYIKGKLSHRYFDMTLAFLSATHRFFESK